MLFNIAIIILGITATLNVLLFTATYRSDTSSVALNNIFRLHIIGIAGWAFFILLLLLNAQAENFPTYHAYESGYLLAQVVFLSATLLFSTNYWFVQYFVHGIFKHTWLNYTVGTLQLLVAALSIIPNALYTEVLVETAGYVSLVIQPLNGMYGIFLLVHLLIPLFILFWHGHKETDKTKRSQYFVLLPSYFLFLLTSITFNWILPVYFGIFNFNAYGPTTSVILVIGIFYAITRYGFLDIRIVIQRGLIYTTILSFIVLIYAGILGIASGLFAEQSLLVKYFSGVFSIIVSVLTVPKIDQYLRTKTDRWFFVGQYNYQKALGELSAILQSSLHMDTLLGACEEKLQEILRAESVRISPQKTTPEATAALTRPIKLQQKLIGTISLGPKKSGADYTEQDHTLLDTFANQAATAISRVFLYQEIRQKADELEEKVIERTAELATAYDNQTEMMLQISHNLQTPLAILQTKLDGLPANLRNATDIEGYSQTLQQVAIFVQQLLRLAKLEQAPEQVAMNECDVSGLLEELVEETAIIADMESITITSDIEAGLTTITNEQHLREVIMNLLSNAIKYIGEGQRSVSVTAAAAADQLVIRVRDTGVGIDEEALEHIFDRFYRTENTTQEATGTGLGLSITKRLVEGIGGSISVTSTPGAGSEFTVTLPQL